MSLYQVQKLLFDVNRGRQVRARFLDERERPIIVNCLAGLPAPLHRCHALGVALRRTVNR